jgi:hypothetical protein
LETSFQTEAVLEIAKHLIIVGAGFSHNAGLPLAGDFTSNLLDVESLKASGPSQKMAVFLNEFVSTTFGNDVEVAASDWPTLEDLFTLVDLAANTEHHLGPDYSASRLRVVRRALIVRAIRMLRQRYFDKRRSPDAAFRMLRRTFKLLDLEDVAILSMNWDTVVESEVESTQGIVSVDYGCDAIAAKFVAEDSVAIEKRKNRHAKLRLIKPHGSTNWLYCDACREVFWLPTSQHEAVAQTLFRQSDWAAVGVDEAPSTRSPLCPKCASRAPGTRFATFSYRKALDFPMHAASWKSAEHLLKEAETWTFIGYSMPPADFEFKHLLKRVEMSRRSKPTIGLVTGGGAASETVATYRKFFGDDFWRTTSGIDAEVLLKLLDLGLLKEPA